MGSDVVPDWGQACNSTVYRIVWRSVKHFFSFPANFFVKRFSTFTRFCRGKLSGHKILWLRAVPSTTDEGRSFLMYYKLHYRNMDSQRFLWYTSFVSAALLKTLTEWMFYGFFQGRFRGRSSVLQNADGRADL